MNLSHIRHSLTQLLGRTVARNPATTLTAIAGLGVVVGVCFWAYIGYLIGATFTQPNTGLFVGLGVYVISFMSQSEAMLSRLDDRIAHVRQLKASI
jgi:hypothetical protein